MFPRESSASFFSDEYQGMVKMPVFRYYSVAGESLGEEAGQSYGFLLLKAF